MNNAVMMVAAWFGVVTFVVMTSNLFQYGIGVAEDRAQPWDPYARTLPVGAAPRFADLQTEASRSRASFQHHWNVETADFDFDSLAASEIEPLKHFYAPYYRAVPLPIRRAVH